MIAWMLIGALLLLLVLCVSGFFSSDFQERGR